MGASLGNRFGQTIGTMFFVRKSSAFWAFDAPSTASRGTRRRRPPCLETLAQERRAVRERRRSPGFNPVGGESAHPRGIAVGAPLRLQAACRPIWPFAVHQHTIAVEDDQSGRPVRHGVGAYELCHRLPDPAAAGVIEALG